MEKSHKEESQGVAKSISRTNCENVSSNLHFLQQDCLLLIFWALNFFDFAVVKGPSDHFRE